MIKLKLSTHKIRIALGESANTQLGCYAGFKEWGSGISNINDISLVLTQGTTPVDFVAAPSNANVQRDIDTIIVPNRDNILHKVNLYYNVNGEDFLLHTADVPAGGSLEYEDKNGWNVYFPEPSGYAINVQALTVTPTDGQTIYYGMLPKAPVTVAGTSKIMIRKPGTLKIGEIYNYSGTAGTAEPWSVYVRKNNTTDYLISTLAVSANERIFSNTALNVPLAIGDFVEVKEIQPTWATNPATCIRGGYLYVE